MKLIAELKKLFEKNDYKIVMRSIEYSNWRKGLNTIDKAQIYLQDKYYSDWFSVYPSAQIINKKELKFFKNSEYLVFYVPKTEKYGFWVAEEYYFKKADRIEIHKNILENDNSITYMLYFKRTDEESIYYINDWCANDLLVNNIPLFEVLKYLSSPKKYGEVYLNCIQKPPYNPSKVMQVAEKLSIHFNLKGKDLLNYLYNNFERNIELNRILAEIIADNYYKKTTGKPGFRGGTGEMNYLICELLGINLNQAFKTRETTLYKTVKDIYPNAVLQYRPKWLRNQSLDIFIPELNTGIEYQGKQHYEPIKFFGGEKQLNIQKNRDNIKKELCNQNNVRLIEWKYDEEISTHALMEKINQLR